MENDNDDSVQPKKYIPNGFHEVKFSKKRLKEMGVF